MNEEVIKAGLNLTGVFLQRNIFNALRNHGFGARREEPYFRRSQFGQILEGTADIFAAIEIKANLTLSLVIECKRANEKQKHWVFETRDNEDELPYPFWYYNSSKYFIDYSYNILFPSLGYRGMKYFDQAIQAFEFKDVQGKPNVNSPEIALSQNMQEKVYVALRQAQEGLSGLYVSHAAEDLANGRNRETVRKMDIAQKVNLITKNGSILYLPIVVTTANLWTMDYDPSEINRLSGTIPADKLTLTEKKWIHYEFPLPDLLQVEGMTIDGKDTPRKSPIFVVNAKAFDEFIEGIKKDSASYILSTR